MNTPNVTDAYKYAKQVIAGKVQACEYVRGACQRHFDDLARPDFPYEFNPAAAEKACTFIQKLPHTKGRWAQKALKITLEPWQKFSICMIFGWVRKTDGLRRFREAYIEVPRKNGKSIIAAAIGNYMLVADNEFGAEVMAGATSEKQAWEVFRPAKLMIDKTPDLKEYFGVEVNAKHIYRPEDGSRFEPIIGNPGDGASPHCAIADEYHEHADDRLYSTMVTGMGARDQPLMLIITTAGSNTGGPCYEKRGIASKVLQGAMDDDRLFAIIYTIDKGDDWTDPAVWAKANPNLGVSVNMDYMEAQVATAKRQPSQQNAVKTKHFNVWVGARSAWLNMEDWNDCGDDTLDEADFLDCPCMVGLDMAVRIDIAAYVKLFWRDVDGHRHYYAFPHFYLPEDAANSAKNANIYAGWSAAGHIELMAGAEIGFADVQSDLLELPATHNIRELAYDPWQATQIAQAVRDEGLTTVEMRATAMYLSPPMRDLEAAITAGRFHHPDNPVFNWMASNVTVKPDGRDNIYPRKDIPENKIDGIVALLYAMGRATLAEDSGNLDDFLTNVVTI